MSVNFIIGGGLILYCGRVSWKIKLSDGFSVLAK